jgi:PD-(D/E)XK nuclease superfamily
MKLTNNHNLPETIINVIKRPQYTKGKSNMSMTELLNSPRIVQLKRKHWDDLTEDAAGMVWSLFGTALHNILEHGKDDHHIVEERVFAEIDGMTISGAIDLQEVEEDGIILSDYKTTSAWAVQNEKQDWHNQLNGYAFLVEKTKGIKVKKLQIVAIIRDWSSREAKQKDTYPQAPIVVIDIPLWTFEDREQYIRDRIHMHTEAFFEVETNGEIAPCTEDEMWAKPEKFAVMKEGGKRAKSVHDTREEADLMLPEKGYFIEHRPGERTRCESFCQVSAFCTTHQQYLSTKEQP